MFIGIHRGDLWLDLENSQNLIHLVIKLFEINYWVLINLRMGISWTSSLTISWDMKACGGWCIEAFISPPNGVSSSQVSKVCVEPQGSVPVSFKAPWFSILWSRFFRYTCYHWPSIYRIDEAPSLPGGVKYQRNARHIPKTRTIVVMSCLLNCYSSRGHICERHPYRSRQFIQSMCELFHKVLQLPIPQF